MSTVLGRIQNYSTALTPSEARVAEFVQASPELAMNASMQEVAKKSGVSIATVGRLAVTLGYRDWKDVRLNLARDSSRPDGRDNPVFSEVSRQDNDEAVIDKVFERNILSLRETSQQLDKKSVLRVVDAVCATDRIVFFGSGGSGCIARDESIRFAHLEVSAEAYTEEFQMMIQASRMCDGQVAFGLSNSGRSKAVVNVLEVARNNKALTVGIANYRNTPLEAASDIFFCTSYPRHGGMTAALTARLATQSIMDTIYVLSAHRGRIATRVAYIDEMLETKLRLPNGKNRRTGGRK